MIAALLSSIVVAANSVTFTATATGVSTNQPLEFVFADKRSDRDYETLFLTDETIDEIRAALIRSGIKAGSPYDVKKCRFWPTGAVVKFSPSLKDYVSDNRGEFSTLPIDFTGGNSTSNMPAAVFALYNCGQSLFQVDDSLDQSQVYGRFTSTKALKKGTRVKFKVTWDGKSFTNAMTPDFPADKTLAEAIKVANGLAQVDSRKMRINSFREGQFFYRAFMPLEKWRDRAERLVQPLEVHLGGTNGVYYTVIDEDWKVAGNDPKLTPRNVDFKEACAFKGDTCFIFAPKDTKLAALYELKAKLPKTFINWYVYAD